MPESHRLDFKGRLRPSYIQNRLLYIGNEIAQALGLDRDSDRQVTVTLTAANGTARATGKLQKNNTLFFEQTEADRLVEVYDKAGIAQVADTPYILHANIEDIKSPHDSEPSIVIESFDSVVSATVKAFRRVKVSRPITVFSFIDARSGKKGGITTASASIVQALNELNNDTSKSTVPVTAWNVLLEVDPGYEISSAEHTVYAFSPRFAELLNELRNGDRVGWVIGHGKVSGYVAKQVQEEFNDPKGYEQGASEPKFPMHRIHFVHTSPMQTAAARNTVGEGIRAIRKVKEQQDLLRDADIVVFVGNSSADFVPDPTDAELAGRSVIDFILPYRSIDSSLSIEASRLPMTNILISGRLDDGDIKGVEVALQSVRLLRAQQPESLFQLILCGADERTEEQLYATLKPEERALLCIIPFVEQATLTHLVATSSIILLPSTADAFGLAALEALSLKKPTLVSDLSGISTYYRSSGMSRWVLPSGQPAAWADRMRELVQSAEDYSAASTDAWKLYESLTSAAEQRTTELFERIQQEENAQISSDPNTTAISSPEDERDSSVSS